MIRNDSDIQWKVWRVSKTGGGRYGRAHKGDVWECSNIGGLVRKNGVILEAKAEERDFWHGYMTLTESGFKVHRIIAETWVENPNPKEYRFVDHIDTNILNNDASNLRWCTNIQNNNNELTRKHKSEGKKRYKFTKEHNNNISKGNIESFKKMTDKQRRIRNNPIIKGIYLRLNKETDTYDYYDSRYHGNKMNEEEVNKILYSFGYNEDAIKDSNIIPEHILKYYVENGKKIYYRT